MPGTGASRALPAPQRNTRNVWFCFRQGPKSHPSQVQPRWGTCPLLLPPHLLGVSPAQSESPRCSLRSGLQRPAQGQPSTHGGYWHRGAGRCSLQAIRLNHSLMSCFTPLRLPLQGAYASNLTLRSTTYSWLRNLPALLRSRAGIPRSS